MPADKVYHFLVSFVLFTIIFSLGVSPRIALGITVFVGLLKEIYDIPTTGFDLWDLIADLLGALVPFMIVSN